MSQSRCTSYLRLKLVSLILTTTLRTNQENPWVKNYTLSSLKWTLLPLHGKTRILRQKYLGGKKTSSQESSMTCIGQAFRRCPVHHATALSVRGTTSKQPEHPRTSQSLIARSVSITSSMTNGFITGYQCAGNRGVDIVHGYINKVYSQRSEMLTGLLTGLPRLTAIPRQISSKFTSRSPWAA